MLKDYFDMAGKRISALGNFYEETVFTGVVDDLPVVVRALINSDANIQRHFGPL